MVQLHPQNFRHIDSPQNSPLLGNQRTSCWMRPKEFSDMQTKASGPPDGKVPVLLLPGAVLGVEAPELTRTRSCWNSRSVDFPVSPPLPSPDPVLHVPPRH